MIELNTTHLMDCLKGLKQMEDESVDCCVTSPPYFGLRDYESDEQVGLETTPDEYIAKLVEIFNEVKRVLKKEGTFWLNIGDSYAGSGFGGYKVDSKYMQTTSKGTINARNKLQGHKKDLVGYKAKDLIGIPWMLAFALRDQGWYLRQDIIWHKKNSMPESIKDRCTKAHEYIFLLTKSPRYYYDNEAIATESKSRDKYVRDRDKNKINKTPGKSKSGGLKTNDYKKSNKRSVWSCSSSMFKGAHFATFPESLIVDCIKAGCPPKGVVLDPFHGAGTTGLVALKNQRNYIGFEVNEEYKKIADKRIADKAGLFNTTWK